MEDAIKVADYIIIRANQLKQPVSNLALHKIMYFLNTVYLLKYYQRLIDTDFERWIYGPVIPEIYFEYANFGRDKIKAPVTHLTAVNSNGLKFIKFDANNLVFNNLSTREFINKHLQSFICIDDFDLVKQAQLEPQWQNKKQGDKYSDLATIRFHEIKANQFWNKQI